MVISMTQPIRILATLALAALACLSTATAQLPLQVPYQGVVHKDFAKGTEKTAMNFSIWDAETGGKMLWEEAQPEVSIAPEADGSYAFNVLLGSINPIPLKEKKDYWLQVVVDADTLSRTMITAVERQRATDPSLTQKFTSEFGYSFMLPATAKFNKLGSAVNVPGETEKQNYLIPGGNGAIMIYYVKEGRMVPRNFQMLDGVHYYQFDSLGRNGMIYRRVYILKDYAIQIDILLTEKGQKEYADKVQAIFDSFVPPPDAIKELQAWRYGRNAKEFEKGRYREFGGPGR
jgi:hypothetical protein